MKLILELPDDLAQAHAEQAARAGIALEEHVIRILATCRTRPPLSAPPRNGEELIAFWEQEGLIGSRPDIGDPLQYARDLRERSENRRGGD